MEEQIDQERLKRLIEDAFANHDKLTEEEIYKNIGVSLISMGIEADPDPRETHFYKPAENIDLKSFPVLSAMSLVRTLSSSITDDQASAKGRDFWEVFKEKAKQEICGADGVRKLIREGKVKEAVAAAIASVLVAGGLGAIWIPVVAAIVIYLIMFLIKVGLDVFCENYAAVVEAIASTE